MRIIAFVLFAAFSAFVQAKTKVACIGDSITFGYGLANRTVEAYPSRLQALLDERFPGKFEVRNFGSSGRGIYLDSMRGREKRGFRWMKEHKQAVEWRPDIVICNLGINDAGEYIKEFTGGRKRGQFVRDYCALLDDYKKAKLYIWTKLSPLAPGQKFYRSADPFLMQRDLDFVASKMGATGIDMQEPLRAVMDEVLSMDKIHPDAKGAQIIAEATFKALLDVKRCERERAERISLDVSAAEWWICAGQSNMQKGWGEFNRTPAEKRRVKNELERLSKVKINFWDFNSGKWERLTDKNALAKSAFGVSFAIRRAEKTKKTVNILYVAAGGAPTESFLSESRMCEVDSKGEFLYPALAAIATNRHSLEKNSDFPCSWVAREYPRRKNNKEEAFWWPVSRMYDMGIKEIAKMRFPVTGVLWYQGESNATTCISPDRPTPRAYQAETLRAVIDELRGGRNIPFVMVGLPSMNRPWERYREVQREVCAEKGAVFVDTFAAGLGEMNDVHPRNKIPFAELAACAVHN